MKNETKLEKGVREQDEKVGEVVDSTLNAMILKVAKDFDTSHGHVLRRIIEQVVWMSCNILGEWKAQGLLPRTISACFEMYSKLNNEEQACPQCEYAEHFASHGEGEKE